MELFGSVRNRHIFQLFVLIKVTYIVNYIPKTLFLKTLLETLSTILNNCPEKEKNEKTF